jgi:hypothetical protein
MAPLPIGPEVLHNNIVVGALTSAIGIEPTIGAQMMVTGISRSGSAN